MIVLIQTYSWNTTMIAFLGHAYVEITDISYTDENSCY